MKLINEIIDDCTEPNVQIADILRKCLVLSFKLDNSTLRDWVNSELNGYKDDTELPDYRIVRTTAKGLFIGPMGSHIADQPIPSGVMKKEHRHLAEEARLRQPLASYEPIARSGDKDNVGIDWPPNITVLYQEKFFEGYALNRATTIIPKSSIIGLVDTVRNRALRVALEIQKEIGTSEEVGSKITPAQVERIVNNYIYGGTNIISGHAEGITQIGQINIGKSDVAGLTAALTGLGIKQSEIDNLLTAIESDKSAGEVSTMGHQTQGWLQRIGGKLLEAGGTAGTEAAKAALTQALMQFLGLS